MHYICPGTCHGVSDHPQNCETKGCDLNNHPLVECNCTDGEHKQESSKNHED